MDFFIPEATSPEDAEHRWQAVKTFVEEPTGWTASDRRIQRLDYTHDGRDEVAEVGEQLEVIGEPVWAIFDTGNAYLVCTPSRGGRRGFPVIVGKSEVRAETDFD